MKQQNEILATCVRVERNEYTDALYLVFEVTDEDLKRRVKKDWMADMEVKLVGNDLVKL